MHDYMKYWRIVRYYYMAKYKISESTLELLLYLYSEKYFTESSMYIFAQTLVWDKARMSKLKKDGWIEIHRPHNINSATIWKVTFKTKSLSHLCTTSLRVVLYLRTISLIHCSKRQRASRTRPTRTLF